MVHVQVTIGRNISKDNPLPQEAWNSFKRETDHLFSGAEDIDNRIVDGQSVWENKETGEKYSEMCYAVLARYTSLAVLIDAMPLIKRKIELMKTEYQQDAIAIMIGQSELR